MVIFRRLLGEVLRDQRMRQGRTLRQVSGDARVSLGYISEILSEVSDAVALEEARVAMQLEATLDTSSIPAPTDSDGRRRGDVVVSAA